MIRQPYDKLILSTDAHKRLALYAVRAMMNAGTDRWPRQAWGISESWSWWVFTAMLLLPAVYDLISLHRIDWATLISTPFIWILYWCQFPPRPHPRLARHRRLIAQTPPLKLSSDPLPTAFCR